MDHVVSYMRYILAIALMASVGAAGCWDVYVIARGQPNDTVSRTLQDWSLAFPALPLVVGFLLGHIFWPTWRIEIK